MSFRPQITDTAEGQKIKHQDIKTNRTLTMGKNKRKRPYGESARKEYSPIAFAQRDYGDGPRTPHRFFAMSHSVSFSHDDTASPAIDMTKKYEIKQVVHKHRNDITIVTAGENIPSTIKSINFVAQEAPAFSNGEKRKRQGKMLKGTKVADSCSPSTIIAELHLKNNDVIPLYACVYGTIIELNKTLTPEILADDPLLDGFLAIILPSGPFPPRENIITEKIDKQDNNI
jgi:hypothetical protein